MAAYDTDKNPTVIINGGGNQVTGKGIVEVKKIVTGNGEQTISGTVTILSKSDEPYTKTWEHKYIIVAPQGSISLPEISVLYRDWDNKIVPTVVGSVSSSIAVDGGTATKKSWKDKEGSKFDGYFVRVNKGAKYVKIKLSGIDKGGIPKGFGTFSYKVKDFPTAQVTGTGTISKLSGAVANVGLGPESVFNGVTFKVTGGFVDDQKFSGVVIPGKLVQNIRLGKKVTIELIYTKNGVPSAKNATGILKVVK